jgi:tRNA pseudouridine32 synthase / 23S rRNA pseudouridine746 synthase
MFNIVYTHPDFIVINKHQDVSVHKDDGDTMLVSEVAQKTNDEALYLVHRLDKMTSGLLILARNARAASLLSGQFAQRKVEKYYLALSEKKPKKKQGMISGDMERSRRSSWKLMMSHHNPAITQFLSSAGDVGRRVFICKPYTGKTHQIRVALKSIGSPILGDPIYNSGDNQSDRGYLHAFAIRFSYNNQPFELICDPRGNDQLGECWRNDATSSVIDQWLTPWALNWPTLRIPREKNPS